LNAADVQSASGLTNPAITQVHALLADDVQSASSVSTPAFGQVHGLNAGDVESASSVSVPGAGQIHALTANDVESASSLTAPALAEVGGTVDTLTAEDVESASGVSVPVLGQIHALLAGDVESASNLTNPALTETAAGTDVLLADDVEAATELSKPVLAVVSAPVEAPPISGPSYSPNAKAALEVYRILFGKKETPSKKRRRVKRLEDAALELLNDFRPDIYQKIDTTALDLAIRDINKRFVPKPNAGPSEKVQIIHALLDEAEKIRREIDQDDEEILLMLAA
jgi:hypothetical protein